MPDEPSHEQLNVYVQDEWKSPLPATVRVHITGEPKPPEIDTSGQPNKPAKFRIPKGIKNVDVEVLFEGYSDKKTIAVAERDWVFTIPKSVFDPATNPNKPETIPTGKRVDVVDGPGPIGAPGVLREAIRAVPAVKYALGVTGIVAAISIIKALRVDFRLAGWGTIVMLFLMVALFLFNRLTQSSASLFVGPARVFTWFTLFLFMATSASMFGSIFFRYPVDLQYWITQNPVGGKHPPSTETRSQRTGDSQPTTQGSTSPEHTTQYYEDLLTKYAGDEQMLATLGREAFAHKQYGWTIKFLEQAKSVQSSKAWEQDYPYLAAAYFLANGDRGKFESELQEMLAEMRLNNSYLHNSATIGFALQNLTDVRLYVDHPAQEYIDAKIIPEATRIKQNL
jgi:hypothetical protein